MRGDTQHEGYAVVSSTQFESGPPASKYANVNDDPEVMEMVKEEEWEERKKKTTKRTKNIEKRVQRQLVLEDGVVKEDSGPVITEDATEDTVTHEEVSNENQKPQNQIEGPDLVEDGWIPVPGGVVISENCTRTINSHDELEDELETEEIQHVGDITNQEAEDHVVGHNDIRDLVAHRQSKGLQISKPQKRVVREATRRRGEKDTVDVKESSRIQDGHVLTETEKTVEREEYDNESAPDSGSSISDGSVHETAKDTAHNIVHTKDEDLLEYYAVPKGKTLAEGVKLGEGMHVVSEDVHEDKQGDDIEPIEEKYKRQGRKPPKQLLLKDRTDALTAQPLDFAREERTRKTETNRWLENHFGSESGRSASISSSQDLNEISDGGNRITITMSPATPDNISDSNPGYNRRWRENSNVGSMNSNMPKPPPPPPPKPERYWNNHGNSHSNSHTINSYSNSYSNRNNSHGYTPPISPSSRSPPSPDDIHKEIVDARSKLRTTGFRLIEEDKENRPIHSERHSDSYNRSGNQTYAEPKKASFSDKVTYRDDVEPVYNSRFSSGYQKSKYQPESPPRKKNMRLKERSLSPIDRIKMKVTTREKKSPSPTNMDRSHSFNITTLPWSLSKKKGSSKSGLSSKNYKSEERLDNYQGSSERNNRSIAKKLFGRLSPSKDGKRTSPIRSFRRNKSPTPSKQSSSISSHFHDDFFAKSSAREAGTQTAHSPKAPPRNKKRRPKHTYFFGQEDTSSSSYNQDEYNPPRYERQRNHDSFSSDQAKYGYNNYAESPVTERYSLTSPKSTILASNYYNGNSSGNWTKTVDPRRKPRHHSEEDRPVTLPRKHHDERHERKNYNSSNTYIYGKESSNDDTESRTRYYNMKNTNDSNSRKPKKHYSTIDKSQSYKPTKNVGRSQSFNVQPQSESRSNDVPVNESYNSMKKDYSYRNDSRNHQDSYRNDSSFSNIANNKTSSRYSSSPYLNLRSPNLIASIARSPSIRDLENQKNSPDYDKRTQFMEGLLNTAPELYHFMHGDEKGEDQTDSKLRQTNSYDTSGNKRSSQVYTFGKDHNDLSRSPSGETAELNKRVSSSLINLNSPSNTLNNRNAKTSFNLKTAGSSLLYSPKFREIQKIEKLKSDAKNRHSGDYSGRSSISFHSSGSPPSAKRDWNMR